MKDPVTNKLQFVWQLSLLLCRIFFLNYYLQVLPLAKNILKNPSTTSFNPWRGLQRCKKTGPSRIHGFVAHHSMNSTIPLNNEPTTWNCPMSPSQRYLLGKWVYYIVYFSRSGIPLGFFNFPKIISPSSQTAHLSQMENHLGCTPSIKLMDRTVYSSLAFFFRVQKMWEDVMGRHRAHHRWLLITYQVHVRNFGLYINYVSCIHIHSI